MCIDAETIFVYPSPISSVSKLESINLAFFKVTNFVFMSLSCYAVAVGIGIKMVDGGFWHKEREYNGW